MTDMEIIDKIQHIRSKNNVNWMDILRLAFRDSPEEARALMGKVNEYDGEIAALLRQLAANGEK
jgi:hypothetical protein|tara:strand:+ start:946 stop:1137 length:192 start_codon:yes stop_codon:yes gene_type:complete